MPFIIGYILMFLLYSNSLHAQMPLSTVLSFAPPPSDASVIYLGNIFGTVEGVLASGGSQIFGQMMSVLNLAVLALGSIVIMYTLIVGTLNTAHEGEFLGKHWSSIWLPVRATVGMTLLIPKTSGYSLMQVLVMWVVIQGVGAADKIWGVALDYLNMGGKVVVATKDNSALQSTGYTSNPTTMGAATLLAGQVCAYMLQRQLENLHDYYLSEANPSEGSPRGPCATENLGNCQNQSYICDFCNNNVPDFLGTLSAINFMSANSAPWSMPIPNFSKDSPGFYYALNGLCGAVYWNSMEKQASDISKNMDLTESQKQTIIVSRGIGVQQMIDFLQPVARAMVENDPQINTSLSNNASTVASSQYGVVLDSSNNICLNKSSESTCYAWGAIPDKSEYAVLLAGNEYNNALNAYQGAVTPALELVNDSNSQDKRKFIEQAKLQGWIFAGAYFFQIVRLSGSAQQDLIIDSQSGLDSSELFTNFPECSQSSVSSTSICKAFYSSSDTKTANAIFDKTTNIVNGGTPNQKTSGEAPVCETLTYKKDSKTSNGFVSIDNGQKNLGDLSCSSTALGYVGNTYFLNIPGEPSYQTANLPPPDLINFPMSKWKWGFKKQSCKWYLLCLNALFDIAFDFIINMFNSLVELFMNLIKSIIMIVFEILWGIVYLALDHAMSQLQNDDNPIINLANMGAEFIDTAIGMYWASLAIPFGVGALAVYSAGIAIVIGLILLLTLPLIMIWMTYFMTIGFICSFYIPLVPYMLFTFGSISWLLAVIESMVAAPVVALGVMSPEGEGILGKSETGLMILINVFLRPSMMVIGFITGIALTYVFVWILNAQYSQVAQYLVNYNSSQTTGGLAGIKFADNTFAKMFAYGSYIAVYISMYSTMAQKAFSLIYQLPDKVLRWVGAQQEAFGQESQHWMDEAKQKQEQMAGKMESGIKIDKDEAKKIVQKGMGDGGGGDGSVS